MRKTKITMAICLVLVISGLISGMSFLYSGKNLEYTWKTLYGDLSAAAGLEINGSCKTEEYITQDNLKIWDYTYSFTSSGVDMKSKYCYDREKYNYNFLRFTIKPLWHINPYSGLSTEAEYCYKKLQEAKATDANTTKVKIYLNEIFDYIPLGGEIAVGDYDSNLGEYASWHKGEKLKDYKDFAEFFKLTVNNDMYMEISEEDINVPNGSDIKEYQFNYVAIHGDYFSADQFLVGLYTPKYVFIYFDGIVDRALDIDKSLIPGGNGIYRLPYKVGDSEDAKENPDTKLYTEELCNFLPLEKDAKVCKVVYREEEDRLFVFTEENKAGYLTIVNATSGELVQKTMLANDWEGSYSYLFSSITFGENYCISSASYMYSARRFIVLTKDENGIYSKELDFSIDEEFVEKYYEDFSWTLFDVELAYKEGKLAMICYAYEEAYNVTDEMKDYRVSNVNIGLVVFDEGELAYVGAIDNSLCDGIKYKHFYNYYFNDSFGNKIYSNYLTVNYSLSWK